MRGNNFLPFINIYAIGSIIIVLIAYNYRSSPLIVFLLSTAISGIIEFFTGYVLDKIFHKRLWDYNKEILNFGNINGYICLRSILIFGLGGLFLVLIILPISLSIKGQLIHVMISILFIIFLFDMLYNLFIYKILKTKNAKAFYEDKGFKYLYY